MARTAHPTKKGPGRKHGQGVEHPGTKKRRPSGAPRGFVQRIASAEKRLRRANVAALGRRQALKAAKAERRGDLPFGLVD